VRDPVTDLLKAHTYTEPTPPNADAFGPLTTSFTRALHGVVLPHGQRSFTVPEDHLMEVIEIIRAGLRATPNATPEVKRQLTKWCKDEEKYIRRLVEG